MTKEECIDRAFHDCEWVDQCHREETYELAKSNLLNALYPFQLDVEEIPPRFEPKLIAVMREIMAMGNMLYYDTYRENGVYWHKDYSGISSLSDIVPYGG